MRQSLNFKYYVHSFLLYFSKSKNIICTGGGGRKPKTQVATRGLKQILPSSLQKETQPDCHLDFSPGGHVRLLTCRSIR